MLPWSFSNTVAAHTHTHTEPPVFSSAEGAVGGGAVPAWVPGTEGISSLLLWAGALPWGRPHSSRLCWL